MDMSNYFSYPANEIYIDYMLEFRFKFDEEDIDIINGRLTEIWGHDEYWFEERDDIFEYFREKLID